MDIYSTGSLSERTFFAWEFIRILQPELGMSGHKKGSSHTGGPGSGRFIQSFGEPGKHPSGEPHFRTHVQSNKRMFGKMSSQINIHSNQCQSEQVFSNKYSP